MRFLRLSLLLLCHLSLLSSVAENKNTVTFYVSSSEGSDSNDGLSPLHPRRTVASIKTKGKIAILLKCDDVFFEKLSGYKDATISSYGSGNRPIVCGLKILKNRKAWEKMNDGIWRLDLSQDSNFGGYSAEIGFNNNTINNVGLIYYPENDKVYGHLVQHYEQLTSNGDFQMTELHKPADIEKHPFQYLFWKIDGDPRQMEDLCFSVYENGIMGLDNCLVKGIAVVGFSRHGICNVKNTTIEDCQIDLIGGSNFLKDRWWSRFGNGIEFWAGDQNDNIVKNCIISRTFDCGVTIQSNSKEIKDVYNIHFVNNRFYHCRQAFEHFINPSGSDYNPQYIDCEFTGNVCFEMGDNDFNSPESRDANILCYEAKDRCIKIKKNTFYGAPYYCGYTKPLGIGNNTVYIYEGQYLNHYHGYKNYPTIYADGKKSISSYKDWSGDNSKIVIIERGSAKDNKIKKRIKKKIGYLKPNLHLERILK